MANLCNSMAEERMGKNKSDYREYRDRELLRAYNEAFSTTELDEAEGDFHTHVVRKVLALPQKVHWLSFWGIYRAVARLLSGKEAVSDIDKEVERCLPLVPEHIKRKADKKYKIAEFIRRLPAKGFFISEEYAKRIIWERKRKG